MHSDLKKFGHFDLLFPSDYSKAGDLGGRDVPVTIVDIEPRHKLQARSGKAEQRPLLHFGDGVKPLVLNRTNGKTLRKMFGPEVTAWIGKRVTLFAEVVDAFGERVEAIRIRSTPAKAAPGSTEEPRHDPTTGEVAEDALGAAWNRYRSAGGTEDGWLSLYRTARAGAPAKPVTAEAATKTASLVDEFIDQQKALAETAVKEGDVF